MISEAYAFSTDWNLVYEAVQLSCLPAFIDNHIERRSEIGIGIYNEDICQGFSLEKLEFGIWEMNCRHKASVIADPFPLITYNTFNIIRSSLDVNMSSHTQLLKYK
ncbi:unnamed protein product [Cuscuta europaea]|uniref:Uncharacterized protein n=1 Tax=Cuscuta europaea TaxID=41803 RepID=A0A9P1EJE9_CUSEU|nr:unnamed protein product [Cuscuta europaea]